MGINLIISFIHNNFTLLVYILWDKNASFLGFGSLLLFPFSTIVCISGIKMLHSLVLGAYAFSFLYKK